MSRYRFSAFGKMLAFLTVIGLILALVPASARAAAFPQKGKSIQMIVGYAPGGSSDTGSRILASGLEKELGVPVVVVNKPGASGQIGLTALATAKPDGYTIGTTTFPIAVVSCLVSERKASYTRSSFQPLALQINDPNLIAVKADSRFKTLKDIVEAAKAKPKTITIASGMLVDDQFAILQFQKLAGIQFAQVNFPQGTSQAVTPLLGGKIDLFCGNVGDLMGPYKSGSVRILGIMDDEPSPFYPGVKTFEEQGYKIYNSSSRGFSLPAGTPKEIVDILSAAVKKVISSEEHKKRTADMALTVKYMDPVAYAKYWEEYESLIKELMPLTKEWGRTDLKLVRKKGEAWASVWPSWERAPLGDTSAGTWRAAARMSH